MARADASGEALFELADFGAEDEAAVVEHGLDAGIDARLEAAVLRLEVDKFHHLYIVAHWGVGGGVTSCRRRGGRCQLGLEDLDDAGAEVVVGGHAVDEAEESLLFGVVAVERVAARAGFDILLRLEGLVFVFRG